MGRKKMRFLIVSKAPNGNQRARRSVDNVVEAWDWYAWYTQIFPLDEVTIEDREQDVEARS